RRRERVTARDRGAPADAPGRRRGARGRRAERALRRGGDGLGQAARGGARRHPGAARGVPREARGVQDPAPLEVRRRLPHDRDGQGAEIPPARARRGDVSAVPGVSGAPGTAWGMDYWLTEPRGPAGAGVPFGLWTSSPAHTTLVLYAMR